MSESVTPESSRPVDGVRVLAGNAFFNVLSLGVSSLAALWLTPFLLRRLGEDGFGVWALLGVLIAVGQQVDMGLGRALVRSVAQHRARSQWVALATDVNRMMGPLLILWLLLVGLGLWLTPALVSALGAPAAWLSRSIVAGRWLLLAMLPLGLSLLGAAVLEGLQQMQYSSGAQAMARVLFAIAAAVAVGLGWGLGGVAAAYTLSVSIQAVVIWQAVRLNLRGRPVRLLPTVGPIHRHELQFGAHVLTVGVLALGFTALNKVALARWVGVDSLAVYEPANIIALQLFALALAWARAAYPALAAAQARGDLPGVRQLYRRALHLLALGMAPLLGLVIVLAEPFMALWLGSGNVGAAGRTLQGLALAWGLAALAAVASMGFWALGRPRWPTLFSALTLLINALLIGLCVPRWGLWGVVLANVVAVGGTSLLTLLLYARQVALPLPDLVGVLLPPLLWSTVVAGLLAGLLQRWGAVGVGDLLILAAIFGLVYAAGVAGGRMLWPSERAWLRAAWRRLLTGMRRR